MYINPILVGVIATIGFEVLCVIVYTAIEFARYRKEHKED